MVLVNSKDTGCNIIYKQLRTDKLIILHIILNICGMIIITLPFFPRQSSTKQSAVPAYRIIPHSIVILRTSGKLQVEKYAWTLLTWLVYMYFTYDYILCQKYFIAAILYAGLFSPVLFSSFFTCKRCAPSWVCSGIVVNKER